ncbi:MAG: hypothetical protein HYV41_00505 [Candidatus Magasanikbacteria bacterium]|nr:hypothetical protein [Candidatus Magasanikbacteria bacterium]
MPFLREKLDAVRDFIDNTGRYTIQYLDEKEIHHKCGATMYLNVLEYEQKNSEIQRIIDRQERMSSYAGLLNAYFESIRFLIADPNDLDRKKELLKRARDLSDQIITRYESQLTMKKQQNKLTPEDQGADESLAKFTQIKNNLDLYITKMVTTQPHVL